MRERSCAPGATPRPSRCPVAADPGPGAAAAELTEARVERARAAGHGVVLATSVLGAASLSEQVGARLALKAESLQRTGSFKLRGALAKLAALGREARRGVVAASAGNHGLAVAYAARAAGVPCVVYMPADAPVAKVGAARDFGAAVDLTSPTLDAAVAAASERAATDERPFVHPYDDLDVVAGQATLGTELLDAVPDLAGVVVPLGGGGLLGGVAWALRRARPDVRVVGVQAAACAAFPASIAAGHPVAVAAEPTIADGIAVKQPGELTLPLVARLVDDVVTVTDDEIAEAMVWLLDRSKLVVEGAGAAAVAALLGGKAGPPARGTTVAVLSGGNVDPGVLAAVIRHHETLVGRSLVLVARLDDRPGELARLLTALAGFGVNVVDVSHVREGLDLGVRETAVQLVVETREGGARERLRQWVAAAGYDLRILDTAPPWAPASTPNAAS